MATDKHRFSVSLDDARAETIRSFADRHDFNVSQVISAILEPAIQAIAWGKLYGAASPDLFPADFNDLFGLPDDLDPRDSRHRMFEAIGALQLAHEQAVSVGFPAAPIASAEAAPTGAPDGARERSRPPHTNRGVTLDAESSPASPSKRKKVRQG